MRLITFVHNGATRIGALVTRNGQEQVVDFQRADPNLPTDMLTFLKGGEAIKSAAQKAITSATDTLSLSAVKLLAEAELVERSRARRVFWVHYVHDIVPCVVVARTVRARTSRIQVRVLFSTGVRSRLT